MRVWVSWSGGKDCALALHELRGTPQLEVVGLLSTVNPEFGRVSIHGVRIGLLRQQADRLGLPLHEVALPSPCSNREYELRMGQALASLAQAGAEAVAFGDLLLQDVRQYREQQVQAAGLAALFPIFGRPTEQVAREEIRLGIRSRLACVDRARLEPRFAGRQFDSGLLSELRSLPGPVDPCGEYGEFHTFTFDSPDFSAPIPVMVGRSVDRDGFVFADLLADG
jgi:uncharacterized protein (TIGR00290 family)